MTEFPRVGLFSKGYDCAQVDAFFEDARRAYEGGVPPEQFSFPPSLVLRDSVAPLVTAGA